MPRAVKLMVMDCPGGIPLDQCGWRAMNPKGVPGVRLFTPLDGDGRDWRKSEIYGEEVDIEEIKDEEIKGDGKKDIVIDGRKTKKMRVIWKEKGK